MPQSKSNFEELQGKYLLLPVSLQQQVLDFIEFLLEKHRVFRASSNSNDFDRLLPNDFSNRGKVMADALSKVAEGEGLSEINPITWQQEMRSDRAFPERD